jgi:ribosomal protein S30
VVSVAGMEGLGRGISHGSLTVAKVRQTATICAMQQDCRRTYFSDIRNVVLKPDSLVRVEEVDPPKTATNWKQALGK